MKIIKKLHVMYFIFSKKNGQQQFFSEITGHKILWRTNDLAKISVPRQNSDLFCIASAFRSAF